jgi:peroxiredoxin
MPNAERRSPVQPGEPAPDFVLPAVDRDGTVSLADYRGKTPLLLATMRGLYCAFCRRHIAQLGLTRRKLQPLGVEVLAIVASPPERARLYYRFRPAGVPLAADPELTIHRAYGVPNRALTPEISQIVASRYVDLARELKIQASDVAEIRSALYRQDGLEPPAADQEDRRDWSQRHGAQFTGQFLVDREGIVRWANIEGAVDGLSSMEKFPTDEEYLAAARGSLGLRPGEWS